jgi:two-component sensor histidine kinase
MLKESQDRIKSMALIHEKLYQSENLAEIDFKEYIKTLVNGLIRSYNVNTGSVSVTLDVKDTFLDIGTAIPCGLIINELVSNSLKHAFPHGNGELTVILHTINNIITLIVKDNGVGIPDTIDFKHTQSLGLHLVTILTEDQLEGEITLDRTKGTTFCITFNKKRRNP